MRKISIVGVGRLGGALAIALARNGYEIENLVGRKKEIAEKVSKFINPKPNLLTAKDFSNISSEIIFITTQDFEIENAAGDLAKKLQNKPCVFHTSGSLSSEILLELKQIGCTVGSLHPLVSVSDSLLGAERFKKAYFCVEGDVGAARIAKRIVSDLEGKSFTVEAEYKSLYHAAAVTASGHFVALVDAALEMFSKCGLEKSEAQKILLPLIKSTVENLETQTTSEALTGTFARADVETFEKHLQSLQKNVSTETAEVYLQLASRSLHLAGEQGASGEKIIEMQRKIKLAKKNLKC